MEDKYGLVRSVPYDYRKHDSLAVAADCVTILALGFDRKELHVLKSILYHASIQNKCVYQFVDKIADARLAFINAEDQELVDVWVKRKKQGLTLPGVIVCDNEHQTQGEPYVKRPLSLRKIVEALTLAASNQNRHGQ